MREILVANFQLHFAALHGDLFDIDALDVPHVAGVGDIVEMKHVEFRHIVGKDDGGARKGDVGQVLALHLRPRVAGVGEVAGIHQIVALAVDVEGAVVKEKVERRVGVVTRLQQYRDVVVEDAVLEHHLAVHR